MSNILQNQQKKGFRDSTSGVKKQSNSPESENKLFCIFFPEKDIITTIDDIPAHSAPGPDTSFGRLVRIIQYGG